MSGYRFRVSNCICLHAVLVRWVDSGLAQPVCRLTKVMSQIRGVSRICPIIAIGPGTDSHSLTQENAKPMLERYFR